MEKFLEFLRNDVGCNEPFSPEYKKNMADLISTRPDLDDLLKWADESVQRSRTRHLLDFSGTLEPTLVREARMRVVIRRAGAIRDELREAERKEKRNQAYANNSLFGRF